MPPAVSVLMPCYNAAANLDEALDSLAAQTLADFEIVAVDDGSTDGTAGLLDRRAAADPRLRVLHTAHAGLIAALNTGLAACQAQIVARLDADDRCHPQRLERQAAWLAAHPETEVLACRVAGFPAGEVRQGFQVYLDWQNSLLSDADIRREIFIESPLAHPSVMFRRERVLALGGYQDHGWAEDYDLWLRLYLQGAGFARLPETLVEWREHPARLTRCDPRYSLENFLRIKACYLMRGPLAGRDGVILWGAGMAGRRLSKHLLRQGAPLRAFIDIDPKKIGSLRRQRPILPPEDLPGLLRAAARPAVLVTVGSRGARQIIRPRLNGLGLVEGRDWWCAA